jgi:hypothetical protein
MFKWKHEKSEQKLTKKVYKENDWSYETFFNFDLYLSFVSISIQNNFKKLIIFNKVLNKFKLSVSISNPVLNLQKTVDLS